MQNFVQQRTAASSKRHPAVPQPKSGPWVIGYTDNTARRSWRHAEPPRAIRCGSPKFATTTDFGSTFRLRRNDARAAKHRLFSACGRQLLDISADSGRSGALIPTGSGAELRRKWGAVSMGRTCATIDVAVADPLNTSIAAAGPAVRTLTFGHIYLKFNVPKLASQDLRQ